MQLISFDQDIMDDFINFLNKIKSSSTGFAPATSGLDLQRAIHCATNIISSNIFLHDIVNSFFL